MIFLKNWWPVIMVTALAIWTSIFVVGCESSQSRETALQAARLTATIDTAIQLSEVTIPALRAEVQGLRLEPMEVNAVALALEEWDLFYFQMKAIKTGGVALFGVADICVWKNRLLPVTDAYLAILNVRSDELSYSSQGTLMRISELWRRGVDNAEGLCTTDEGRGSDLSVGADLIRAGAVIVRLLI